MTALAFLIKGKTRQSSCPFVPVRRPRIPKAYFVQNGGKLICQSCMFEFTAEEVGASRMGCSPWPIDGIEISETEIRIPVSSVEAMTSEFAFRAGPKGS